MKAFISYSHQDASMLDLLHKHLVQLQRDNLLSTWTDRDIHAGGDISTIISNSLRGSELFIALISPDYIASNYCYEKEFQTALQMQEAGKTIIVPIILESCDWLSTPFKNFKALPKDGKAVSLWENKNIAFLDITQNLRRLLQGIEPDVPRSKSTMGIVTTPSRNYRVKKDFDSLEKLEFVEKTFHEVKDLMKRYIEEVIQIENIKARILIDTKDKFESVLINRNKIATEAQLTIKISSVNNRGQSPFYFSNDLSYSVNESNRTNERGFSLSFDDFHLFWTQQNHFGGSGNKEFTSKEIADLVWSQWLESVGIII